VEEKAKSTLVSARIRSCSFATSLSGSEPLQHRPRRPQPLPSAFTALIALPPPRQSEPVITLVSDQRDNGRGFRRVYRNPRSAQEKQRSAWRRNERASGATSMRGAERSKRRMQGQGQPDPRRESSMGNASSRISGGEIGRRTASSGEVEGEKVALPARGRVRQRKSRSRAASHSKRSLPPPNPAKLPFPPHFRR
jgi:hypothetical protein